MTSLCALHILRSSIFGSHLFGCSSIECLCRMQHLDIKNLSERKKKTPNSHQMRYALCCAYMRCCQSNRDAKFRTDDCRMRRLSNAQQPLATKQQKYFTKNIQNNSLSDLIRYKKKAKNLYGAICLRARIVFHLCSTARIASFRTLLIFMQWKREENGKLSNVVSYRRRYS